MQYRYYVAPDGDGLFRLPMSFFIATTRRQHSRNTPAPASGPFMWCGTMVASG